MPLTRPSASFFLLPLSTTELPPRGPTLRGVTASTQGIPLLIIGASGGRTWLFDLRSMPVRDVPATWAALKPALESPAKILHDGRQQYAAIFRLHGIRVAPVRDTQVAHGMIQVLQSLSGTGVTTSPQAFSPVLEAHGFPANPRLAAGHRGAGGSTAPGQGPLRVCAHRGGAVLPAGAAPGGGVQAASGRAARAHL